MRTAATRASDESAKRKRQQRGTTKGLFARVAALLEVPLPDFDVPAPAVDIPAGVHPIPLPPKRTTNKHRPKGAPGPRPYVCVAPRSLPSRLHPAPPPQPCPLPHPPHAPTPTRAPFPHSLPPSPLVLVCGRQVTRPDPFWTHGPGVCDAGVGSNSVQRRTASEGRCYFRAKAACSSEGEANGG